MQQILCWYENRLVHSVEVQAGDFKPRRLSGPEYRNTLRSVLGFDLETTIKVAEQTVTEPSLVLKLLPDDPPGESGYMNDTRNAPLNSHLWEQYAYIADRAFGELFSEQKRPALAQLIGEELTNEFQPSDLSSQQARSLLSRLANLANRRPIPQCPSLILCITPGSLRRLAAQGDQSHPRLPKLSLSRAPRRGRTRQTATRRRLRARRATFLLSPGKHARQPAFGNGRERRSTHPRGTRQSN